MDQQLVENGREIAEKGRAADKVPACLSCHEKPGGNPAYPRISGQNAPYLERQLRLFHAGVRGGSSFSHLMTEAARNLGENDFAALAAFLPAARAVGLEVKASLLPRSSKTQTGTTIM